MTDIDTNKPQVGISREKAAEPELGQGPINGFRYNSTDFAALEWEQMWTKVWLVAGRVDQLSHPGDYITLSIGSESILCSMGSDNKIHAFYNVCQHRGNLLVSAETGSLNGGDFTCAYHGWRFDNDGTLVWVHCEEDFPQGNPCGKRNLVEIPCDTWGGFIWINMDSECEDLLDYLSPVSEHLDCYQMEQMKRTHWVTLEGDFNWKVVQDNFNESYHLPFVHPQTVTVMNEHYSGCQFDMYPTGHCRMLMPGGGPGPQYEGSYEKTFKGLQEDFAFWEFDPSPFKDDLSTLRVALQKHKRQIGPEKGYDFSLYSDEQLTDHYHYTAFPNVSFSMKPDGCIFLMAYPHPDNPKKCFFNMWYLTKFPEGAKEYYSNSMRDWVSIDEQVEHETGSVGEISCGHGIDQDVAIWSSQQQGLSSRGYRGEYIPHQERRIRFFHENIDRYLSSNFDH